MGIKKRGVGGFSPVQGGCVHTMYVQTPCLLFGLKYRTDNWILLLCECGVTTRRLTFS